MPWWFRCCGFKDQIIVKINCTWKGSGARWVGPISCGVRGGNGERRTRRRDERPANKTSAAECGLSEGVGSRIELLKSTGII